ncbi:MAG: thioredoxin family protein [Thermoguttaceae bacterium]
MTALGLVSIVPIALIAAGGETYAEAHRTATHTGRPIVVLVGADWCPACRQMTEQVVPQVRQRGLLRRVAFAFVNLDREKELGGLLTGNGPIPQLLMFRRTPEGWRLRRLIGVCDAQTMERFIRQGIELDQAGRGGQPVAGQEAEREEPVASGPPPVPKAATAVKPKPPPR